MSIEITSLQDLECLTKTIPTITNLLKISEEHKQWKYLDLKKIARKLNRILKSEPIRKLYDYTSRMYSAVRRYEYLKDSNFTQYPGHWTFIKNELWLPDDVNSTDWRYCRAGAGRQPLYFDYVTHGGCHWHVEANIEVARKLMPEYNWIIVSSSKHSTVMAPEAYLIFDMQYVALEVSELAGLELLFGKNLTDFTDILIGTKDNPYRCSEGFAGPAMRLFNLIDIEYKGKTEEALKKLREFMLESEEATMRMHTETKLIRPAFELDCMGA